MYRGRYLVDRDVTQALGERYDRAPESWLPVVTLTELAGRARQSVYAWVGRQSRTQTFIHPKRAQPAQHLPVQDALDYLSYVLGSAHHAIKLLARYTNYFRSLGTTVVETLHPKDTCTLDITFVPGITHPPPLNPSHLGHGLLSLRT